MKNAGVFAIMFVLTFFLVYEFYNTTSWTFFFMAWLPIPAYAIMAAYKETAQDFNEAAVYEDMADSDMGATLPIYHLYELPIFHGQQSRLSTEPILQKKTGKLFILFKVRAGSWSNGYIARTVYETINQAFYANMNPVLEPRSDGEIRRWANQVINPEDSQRSGLWAGLLRLVKKRAKVADFDINSAAQQMS